MYLFFSESLFHRCSPASSTFFLFPFHSHRPEPLSMPERVALLDCDIASAFAPPFFLARDPRFRLRAGSRPSRAPPTRSSAPRLKIYPGAVRFLFKLKARPSLPPGALFLPFRGSLISRFSSIHHLPCPARILILQPPSPATPTLGDPLRFNFACSKRK